MSRERWVVAGVLAALVGWQFGSAAWISAKAALGQGLLELAWERARAGDRDARPWPGAPSVPVARLHVHALGVRLLVLAGDDGATLAWGPGLVAAGPDPLHAGHLVVAAHRDTHFGFLATLEPGHRVALEGRDRRRTDWQVVATRVVDSRHTALDLHDPGPLLTLVTCYPFDAIRAGGPLRFVVSLRPAEMAGDPDRSADRLLKEAAAGSRSQPLGVHGEPALPEQLLRTDDPGRRFF